MTSRPHVRPRAWTRASFVSFGLLSLLMLLFGAYFLSAVLDPQAHVVVRSCRELGQTLSGGQQCAVAYRHDGATDLVDVETDRLYPAGHVMTVHVHAPGQLVEDHKAHAGVVFLPLGVVGLALVIWRGWPARPAVPVEAPVEVAPE